MKKSKSAIYKSKKRKVSKATRRKIYRSKRSLFKRKMGEKTKKRMRRKSRKRGMQFMRGGSKTSFQVLGAPAGGTAGGVGPSEFVNKHLRMKISFCSI